MIYDGEQPPQDTQDVSRVPDEALEAAGLSPVSWAVGQIWKTEHGHLMRVESVRADGVALIAMIAPYKTRAYTQKPIPSGWVKQPNKENKSPIVERSELFGTCCCGAPARGRM